MRRTGTALLALLGTGCTPPAEPGDPTTTTVPTVPTVPTTDTGPTDTDTDPTTVAEGPPVRYEFTDRGLSFDNGLLRVRTVPEGLMWFDVFHPGEGVWYENRNVLNLFVKNIDGVVNVTEGQHVTPAVELVSGDEDATTLAFRWDFPNGVLLVADVTMRRGDPRIEYVLRREAGSAELFEFQWQVTFGQAEAVKELAFGERVVDADAFPLPLPGGTFENQRVDWFGDLTDDDFVFHGEEAAAADPNNPEFLWRALGLVQHVTWGPVRPQDRIATETRDVPWQPGWEIPTIVPWIEGVWFDRYQDFPEYDTLIYGIDNLDDYR